MQTLRDRNKYQYEEIPNGARVRITTSEPEALRAIHEFLAYQAREHRALGPVRILGFVQGGVGCLQ